jgi:hypothetical protein
METIIGVPRGEAPLDPEREMTRLAATRHLPDLPHFHESPSITTTTILVVPG